MIGQTPDENLFPLPRQLELFPQPAQSSDARNVAERLRIVREVFVELGRRTAIKAVERKVGR